MSKVERSGGGSVPVPGGDEVWEEGEKISVFWGEGGPRGGGLEGGVLWLLQTGKLVVG